MIILLTLTKQPRNGTVLFKKIFKCKINALLILRFLAMLNDLARLVCVHMLMELYAQRHREQRTKFRNAHMMKVIDNNPA